MEVTHRLSTVSHSQYMTGAVGGQAAVVGVRGSGLALLALHHPARHCLFPHPSPTPDKHYSFGPQSLSNIIYSAASMGLKADYDLLHAVGRAVAWEIAEFKPQVGGLCWW